MKKIVKNIFPAIYLVVCPFCLVAFASSSN